MGVLHGARGVARDGARRNDGETGESSRMIDLPHSPNYLLPDTNYSYRAKKRFGNS